MEKQNIIPMPEGSKQASSEKPAKFDKLSNSETNKSFDFSKDKKLNK
jgi:hypothetical protein